MWFVRRLRLVLASLALLCAHPAPGSEVRAVWVTRWEYSSPNDIRQIMAWLARNGFNVVLFQVRGQATSYYRSDIEPPATALGEQLTWDPLEVAVREAHDRGLELHAWVNVYPGWRGNQRHPSSRQVWNLHPEWFLLSVDGRREYLGGDYAYLTPTLPSVRQYLLNVFRELWRRYEIDGLHLDYFRYPGPGYGFDPESVALFRARTGHSPEEDRQGWDDFRRASVTELLRKVREALYRDRPEARLTAAIIGDYRIARAIFLQDSHFWMAEGLLDAAFPMTYSSDTLRFTREVREHLADAHQILVCPGITVEKNPAALQEIRIARRLGAHGFCFFSFASLRQRAESDSVFAQLLRRELGEQASRVDWPEVWSSDVDRRGPTIETIRLKPSGVASDREWGVECRITDPSGVLVRQSPPRSPYLIWTDASPEDGGQVANLVPVPGIPGRYTTRTSLPTVAPGSLVYFRIFAADRSHPNPAFCNWNFSPLERTYAVPSASHWRFKGKLPSAIWGLQACAVDGHGNIWIIEGLRSRLRVFSPDGRELWFSPLDADRFGRLHTSHLSGFVSLAARGDRVYVVERSNGGVLLTLDASTGRVISRAQLERLPGDLEISESGKLYGAEKQGSCWWVLDENGFTEKQPICTSHMTQGIAVLGEDELVLATCRSEDVVHAWETMERRELLFEEIPKTLPFHDIRIGDVETGPDGHIFLCLTGGGLVLELNRDFKVVDALGRELRAPLTLALSPDGRRAYVAEAPGIGPEFVYIYERD